jgi:hypothetical protein
MLQCHLLASVLDGRYVMMPKSVDAAIRTREVVGSGFLAANQFFMHWQISAAKQEKA